MEIARALAMPMDLVIPRKIGHPHNPEYAIGAVTEEGDLVVNQWDNAADVDIDSLTCFMINVL